MRDLWHDLLEKADYHRGALFGVGIAVMLALALFGCDVTTTSLVDPNRTVNSQQLLAEVSLLEKNLSTRQNQLIADIATFNDEAKRLDESFISATTDLQRKYELRAQLVQAVGGFAVDAASGQFNPISAISTLVSLLSLGAAGGLAVDNYRKGRVIKVLKDGESTLAV